MKRDVHGEGVESVSHCLVGKVLSIKAFRNMIDQIWGTMGLIEIQALAENFFVFHFQSLEDRQMVWARGPWHLDQCLIVLVKPFHFKVLPFHSMAPPKSPSSSS
ncbi:hypothetical protein Ddye_024015 [Dipteronia dyeriana]|uniref:DUF4283 domain-containing protein n=1 Tax=Dipteronia dyeriana TaxID=168575 RepID=A0AAD9TUI0_9ROSI|nr:hypothetical protein Ddye_024015 [Dipteronia dyeriana]